LTSSLCNEVRKLYNTLELLVVKAFIMYQQISSTFHLKTTKCNYQ